MLGIWGFYEMRQMGKAINAADLVKIMNAHSALVVDVRPENEYRNGHITSSINCPYARVQELPAILDQHKQRQTVLVCSNGRNSAAAQGLMKKKGYKVERLNGGLVEWSAADLPLVKKHN